VVCLYYYGVFIDLFLKKWEKREANLQSKGVKRKEMAWFALKVGYINDKIGDSPCLSNLLILIMASNKSLQIVLNLSCFLAFFISFHFLNERFLCWNRVLKNKVEDDFYNDKGMIVADIEIKIDTFFIWFMFLIVAITPLSSENQI